MSKYTALFQDWLETFGDREPGVRTVMIETVPSIMENHRNSKNSKKVMEAMMNRICDKKIEVRQECISSCKKILERGIEKGIFDARIIDEVGGRVIDTEKGIRASAIDLVADIYDKFCKPDKIDKEWTSKSKEYKDIPKHFFQCYINLAVNPMKDKTELDRIEQKFLECFLKCRRGSVTPLLGLWTLIGQDEQTTNGFIAMIKTFAQRRHRLAILSKKILDDIEGSIMGYIDKGEKSNSPQIIQAATNLLNIATSDDVTPETVVEYLSKDKNLVKELSLISHPPGVSKTCLANKLKDLPKELASLVKKCICHVVTAENISELLHICETAIEKPEGKLALGVVGLDFLSKFVKQNPQMLFDFFPKIVNILEKFSNITESDINIKCETLCLQISSILGKYISLETSNLNSFMLVDDVKSAIKTVTCYAYKPSMWSNAGLVVKTILGLSAFDENIQQESVSQLIETAKKNIFKSKYNISIGGSIKVIKCLLKSSNKLYNINILSKCMDQLSKIFEFAESTVISQSLPPTLTKHEKHTIRKLALELTAEFCSPLISLDSEGALERIRLTMKSPPPWLNTKLTPVLKNLIDSNLACPLGIDDVSDDFRVAACKCYLKAVKRAFFKPTSDDLASIAAMISSKNKTNDDHFMYIFLYIKDTLEGPFLPSNETDIKSRSRADTTDLLRITIALLPLISAKHAKIKADKVLKEVISRCIYNYESDDRRIHQLMICVVVYFVLSISRLTLITETNNKACHSIISSFFQNAVNCGRKAEKMRMCVRIDSILSVLKNYRDSDHFKFPPSMSKDMPYQIALAMCSEIVNKMCSLSTIEEMSKDFKDLAFPSIPLIEKISKEERQKFESVKNTVKNTVKYSVKSIMNDSPSTSSSKVVGQLNLDSDEEENNTVKRSSSVTSIKRKKPSKRISSNKKRKYDESDDSSDSPSVTSVSKSDGTSDAPSITSVKSHETSDRASDSCEILEETKIEVTARRSSRLKQR
eukprot:GHVL01020469.1.p1 GENE.GHVL01020469.1~~GHVL01020469.1.p1  ORF type:complete len:989 (-),score=231.24 GHVL01020469.1:196-3162(-)